MAIKNINYTKLGQNVTSVCTFTAATTANDGVAIDFTEQDAKTVILAKNEHASAAQTFTVKMGDGVQGVVDYVSENIAAGEMVAINLESGRFKKLSGTNKGKVHIVPSSTDVKFAVVVMP